MGLVSSTSGLGTPIGAPDADTISLVGVLYFKYITFIGHIELVVHRCLWTTFTLVITTFLFSKWDIFFTIIRSKKKLLYLFFSGFLIFINWAVWIYAIMHCTIEENNSLF